MTELRRRRSIDFIARSADDDDHVPLYIYYLGSVSSALFRWITVNPTIVLTLVASATLIRSIRCDLVHALQYITGCWHSLT